MPIDNIYSLSSIINYLTDNGVSPTKKRGQNFLYDRNTALNIVNVIPHSFKRSVSCLEIGGGLGSITHNLIEVYKNNFTVVEYDKALYNYLFSEYGEKANVVHSDILEFNLDFNEKIDVYGNIPYNITSPILEWLLNKNYGKWNYAVFMVQRDFALRLVSKEGTDNYSALTAFASFLADIKLEFNVSKNIFYPKPKIDSSVISLIPKKVDVDIIEKYKSVSKSMFHNRRKTLRNNLLNSPYIKLDIDKVESILKTLNIDKNERGENIPIETIEAVARLL